MKKSIVIFLVFLSVSGFAQTRNNFSAFVGVNYTSVSSINSANPDGIFGLNAGLAYKIYLDDLGWFIKPGLAFSQEGYLLQRLDYLNVPLALGFDFTDDFNVHVGFQYGFLIGGLNDPDEIFYRSNMAFLVGLEFYPTSYLEVGIRFANGVKNLIKQPDAIVIDDARTYAIQFYFTVNLNRLKKQG